MRVRFRLYTDTSQGTPSVSGDPEPLGAWDPARALRMRQGSQGVWEAEAELPSRFAYRFLLLDADEPAAVGTEEAAVRCADLERVAPGPDGVRTVVNAWQATLVRFVAHHPLPVGQQLALVGGHPHLGGWQSPRPMELGDERPLDSGGRGRCWEALVAFADRTDELAYRYVVLASEARWEREPDRHVAVAAVDEVVNGLVEVSDRNIVTGLDLSWVDADVCVGPYPQTAQHADALARAGVTAVVNLQTDGDLRHRGVNVEWLHDRLRSQGIELHRMPIRDFDEADLIRHLPAAAALLHRLAQGGHRVYVHCTAGMGRAPAVILTYLVGQGRELAEARALLQHRHPVSAPNVDAVVCATTGVAHG